MRTIPCMGMLKKAVSGVLALVPCSRTRGTLRAQKGLRPFLRATSGQALRKASGRDWTDPSADSWHAFDHSHHIEVTMALKAFSSLAIELFNSPLDVPGIRTTLPDNPALILPEYKDSATFTHTRNQLCLHKKECFCGN